MKVRDLSKVITAKYANHWVALSRDYKKVIGSALTFEELSEKVEGKDVVYMRIPSGKIIHVF